MAAIFDWISKDQVLNQIFTTNDTNFLGELSAKQLKDIHASIRDGGISLAQVEASIRAVCATDSCDREELFDVLNEMDRRYFLVRDLQWEFAMLDREQKGTVSEREARFLFQAVHDDFFSHRKWLKFLRGRAAPGTGISFAEIEVPLCDIPTIDWLEEDKEDQEKDRDELLKQKSDMERKQVEARKAAAAKAEFEKEAGRRKADALKRKAAEEEAWRKAQEEEKQRKLQAEKEKKEKARREREAIKQAEHEARRWEQDEIQRQEDALKSAEEEAKRKQEEEARQKWKKDELLEQQELERERQEQGICVIPAGSSLGREGRGGIGGGRGEG